MLILDTFLVLVDENLCSYFCILSRSKFHSNSCAYFFKLCKQQASKIETLCIAETGCFNGSRNTNIVD